MLSRITRILTFIISFQLASCGFVNNSHMAIIGNGGINAGDFFNITGTIVKTFQRLDNLLLSSAMAADHTGTIEVTDFTDPENPILIEQLKLYDGKLTFDLKISKDKVKDKVVVIEYVKKSDSEMRQKIEDLSQYSDSVDVILDANITFHTAIQKAEIASLIASDPANNDEAVIKELINKYDVKQYEAATKLIDPKTFVAQVKDENSFAQIGALIYENKDVKDGTEAYKPYSQEMALLLANAKVVEQSGGKLVCDSGNQPEVVETAGFDGTLDFSTSDEATIALIGKSKSLGKEGVGSAISGNQLLDIFYEDISRYVKEGKTIKGKITLVDKKNKITTGCMIVYGPPPVKATKADFDKIVLSKFKSADEAIKSIGEAYVATVIRLKADFNNAKIDIKDNGAGQAAYDAEIKIAKGWNEELTAKAKAYPY